MKKGLIRIMGLYGDKQHQSNTVYKGGIIPALTTIEGGGTQQIKVIREWKSK